MPLFFFISGMTFHDPDDIRNFILKKINRIMVPYVFFTILSVLICFLIYESPKLSSGFDFNEPLWFLQTLFLGLMIYLFLCKVISNRIYLTFVVFLLAFISYYTTKIGIAESFPWHIMRAFMALLFIHFGCLFSSLSNVIVLKGGRQYVVLLLSGVIYCMSCLISMYKYYECESFSFVGSQVYTYNFVLFLLASISGIIFVVIICNMLKYNRFICYWGGKNSLIVLCVHFPVIEQLNIIASKTFLYTFNVGKVILMVMIVSIIMLWSFLCVKICNKYIPQWTGFKNLL